MANPNLTAGYVFQPTGRELIDHYLVPRAGLGGDIFPGFIEEGVDVLSLPPRELPFRENHIRDYGEVWGFFFAAKPAGETCLTPGARGRVLGAVRHEEAVLRQRGRPGGSGVPAQVHVPPHVERRGGMVADALADEGVLAQQGRGRLPSRAPGPRGAGRRRRGPQGLPASPARRRRQQLQRQRGGGLRALHGVEEEAVVELCNCMLISSELLCLYSASFQFWI
uniref:NAC domain-containing protein n=1 Tax=Triticum urartu TaxID=4572 RepID=A0A8R7PH17_TRIUA